MAKYECITKAHYIHRLFTLALTIGCLALLLVPLATRLSHADRLTISIAPGDRITMTCTTSLSGVNVWYCDPYGCNISAQPFPGSVPQYISASQYTQQVPSLVFGTNNDHDAPGVHNPISLPTNCGSKAVTIRWQRKDLEELQILHTYRTPPCF